MSVHSQNKNFILTNNPVSKYESTNTVKQHHYIIISRTLKKIGIKESLWIDTEIQVYTFRLINNWIKYLMYYTQK